MATAYLGIGTNLGDRRGLLHAAVRRLRAEPGLRVLAVSRYHETRPVDCPPDSGDFLNAAIAVETGRSPEELLAFLHRVEARFGRERSERNAPRTLDLDLLLYDDRVVGLASGGREPPDSNPETPTANQGAHAPRSPDRQDQGADAPRSPSLQLPHPRLHERAFVLVPLAEIAPNVVHPVQGKTIAQLLEQIGTQDVQPVDSEEPGSNQLRGLTALVTGSTSGIGKAIATGFRREGARVITHGRKPGDALHIAADLSDMSAVDRLANEAWDLTQGLDAVVLNAGADTLTGEAGKWPFDRKLETLLDIDLKSTMRLGRAFGTRMKSRGRGSIITTGWDQALTGMEGDSGQLFSATKGAVMAFSRSLALSLAPEVRVNCIAPGWIRTAWGETASEYWQERVRQETPLGIWGLPEDVAAAAVWLSSPAAAFITGQTINVNGGVV